MDSRSKDSNGEQRINRSDFIDIWKANVSENPLVFDIEDANESDLNADLKTLMKIVPFLVPILFSVIIIIGFIGNLLVVFVVTLNKNMRNTTNLLILNLAVSIICILGIKDHFLMINIVTFQVQQYILSLVFISFFKKIK